MRGIHIYLRDCRCQAAAAEPPLPSRRRAAAGLPPGRRHHCPGLKPHAGVKKRGGFLSNLGKPNSFKEKLI